MIRYRTLLIAFFSITTIYSMQHFTQENVTAHVRLSKQAAELICSNIDETTVPKWRSLLEQAEKFQKENPNFPYLHLARRAGQGPDAQEIANAAPIVIDCIEKRCIDRASLERFRFTLGDRYISKLIDTSKK